MTAPYYADESVTLHHGNCLDVLRALPDNSVDAVVTDPPYGLGFMGKEWDDLPPGLPFAQECLRVLKPGGYLVAFGGSRTWHRLAVAVEDAGFEIRDSIAWLYGSGFPKSLDVSKAIDKRRDEKFEAERRGIILAVTTWIAEARDRAGISNRLIDEAFGTNGMAGHWTSSMSQPAVPTAEQWPALLTMLGVDQPPQHVREAVDAWLKIKGQPCPTWDEREVLSERVIEVKGGNGGWSDMVHSGRFRPGEKVIRETAPATAAAQQWQGWGTALKPAFEPIVVGRKPLTGTVASNILQHGTGALNIAACRTDTHSEGPGTTPSSSVDGQRGSMAGPMDRVRYDASKGRWPTNVVLDESQAAELDKQTGDLGKSAGVRGRGGSIYANGDGFANSVSEVGQTVGYGDSGGASRFFPVFRYQAKAPTKERPKVDGVAHPTVKPLELMRWLVRLVTPPGGTVLEPFAGSGTTAEACVLEGVRCIAIEREADYLPLIVARLTKHTQTALGFGGAA